MSNESPSSAVRACRGCGALLSEDAPGSACWSCMIEAGAPKTSGSQAQDPASTDGQQPAAHEATNDLSATQLAPARSNADPLPDGAVGQTIGCYKLREQLGEGGCGVVYVAEQSEPVRRRVALKLIKLGMDSKQVIARFEAERQALAMMDHPNMAKVFDAGTTETGRPYFVMELVRGIKITDYCDQTRLSTRKRIELFINVCRAVQHAHQKGIIHRDLKPSNILVTLHDGVPVPKVIDFGIAKATEGRLTDATVYTQLNQLIGTPAYMSPEQAEMSGLDIDTRSDIYSLGVLLYELLAGSTPFDALELLASGLDAMRKTIREKEPVRPSTRLATLKGAEGTTTAKSRSAEVPQLIHQLKGDLDWIVMKCLEKDRGRRYDTANGLAADLQRHLDNEPVVARPASQLYRFQKMVRRNKAATVAVASVLTALAVGFGLSLAALLRERQARVREQEARQRELAQTVRADSVASYVITLLSDVLPTMVLQGNIRGAREMINKADKLASSSLSNAPAAEINFRYQLRNTLNRLLGDYPAALHQMEAISELLPKVSDDQLVVSRDELRIAVSSARLWAAGTQVEHQEKALNELEDLYVEFMGRTPPAKRAAMICRAEQGKWYGEGGNTIENFQKAAGACAEAYQLLRRDSDATYWRYRLPAHYAGVLLATGKPALAEEIARESLGTAPGAKAETRDGYGELVATLNDILCQQDRFAEAAKMLDDQRGMLVQRGGTESEMLRVNELRGAVLARSGKAREALPIWESVATNRLCSVYSWRVAVYVALAVGDDAPYQRLIQNGLLRFASTAEGYVAAMLAECILRHRNNEMTVSIARALLERIPNVQDWGADFIDAYRAMLADREQRPADALELLEKNSKSTPTGLVRSGWDKIPILRAEGGFWKAKFYTELGQVQEARQHFAQGREFLKLVLGDNPAHDRGVMWALTYTAETRQREAEEVFKAKGIPLPEPPAK